MNYEFWQEGGQWIVQIRNADGELLHTERDTFVGSALARATRWSEGQSQN